MAGVGRHARSVLKPRRGCHQDTTESHRCAAFQSSASRWACTRSGADDVHDNAHRTGYDARDEEQDGIKIAFDLISPILLLPFG
jgi:hypothetical protein